MIGVDGFKLRGSCFEPVAQNENASNNRQRHSRNEDVVALSLRIGLTVFLFEFVDTLFDDLAITTILGEDVQGAIE